LKSSRDTLPPVIIIYHKMWFLHKRKFEKLVDENEAKRNFAKVRTELEKGDLKAMVIAALVVFIPFILLIIGGMFLLAWLLGR